MSTNLMACYTITINVKHNKNVMITQWHILWTSKVNRLHAVNHLTEAW